MVPRLGDEIEEDELGVWRQSMKEEEEGVECGGVGMAEVVSVRSSFE